MLHLTMNSDANIATPFTDRVMRGVKALLLLLLVQMGSSLAIVEGYPGTSTPPTLDDFWNGSAFFAAVTAFPLGDPGLLHVDAGTRVVVINQTWYDPLSPGACFSLTAPSICELYSFQIIHVRGCSVLMARK